MQALHAFLQFAITSLLLKPRGPLDLETLNPGEPGTEIGVGHRNLCFKH